MDDFLKAVTPALLTFLSVAVPALLAWLTNIVRCWANKQNEAKDREALHSALATGMTVAETKYGASGNTSEKVAYAIDHAQKSVPDAMRNLNPPADVLAKIAMSKQAIPKEKPNA